ncbi:wax ester/triacylglycerol synthase family O-acyltransferase [Marinobacter sp. 1_MG-2023]|uniref:WS/DGAT/MGAT family O-acyltransferase n=1 Tax=Marinobacter sp. 1_MG-2023 TaxID=3062627 RepID=UPI0026E2E9DC|nr:wax ester/triacylglycerol synthase family O-acyltransferase [Marinobacter sp. 1_MG-2023]MDO6825175.1 wax ester/triacylglycerol synthase family O-acyltransferase [Marinobacter sp. 1_MG-2023]
MRQLSELDASFLYLESANAPMHIGSIYLFDASERDAPLAFSTFISHLRSRLHVVPVFRQRLKEIPLRLGRPYWIDDPEFSIERHLAYVSLGVNSRESNLMTLASKILEEPLKRDRPLWHITFVDGFQLGEKNAEESSKKGREGFALIVKLHHAAIDAFSGEEIIGKLLEYTPQPQPINAPRPWKARPKPSEERVIIQAGANILRTPWRFASLAAGAAETTARGLIQKQLLKIPLPFPLFSAPHSPFNRKITPNRQIVPAKVELSRLKAIKAALGDVTLNDVVLGLCAETLKRYLGTQDADTRQSLIAMTPISVRSSTLSRTTGNQMSAMLLDLATNEPDPARRIRKIHWNAVSSEPYRDAIAADRLTELLPSNMLALSARLYSELQIAQRYRPVFNLAITNVPGPKVPLYLQGAKLTQQYNTAPLFDSMGLVVVAMSYQGSLTLNFTVCPDVVPQGSSLRKHVCDSLEAIEKAASELDPEELHTPLTETRSQTLADNAMGLLEGALKRLTGRFRR